jgi:hypothetical protein
MRTLEIDLHGYHPDDICGAALAEIVEQAWQTGAERLQLIHGHGHNRGLSVGFVNTNTGFFGLRIRAELRSDRALRCFIKHTTLDCSHPGATSVKLKPNSKPTREEFDRSRLPDSSIPYRYGWRGRGAA